MKKFVQLKDPILDERDTFTRMFLLAEYWKNKYLALKQKHTTQPQEAVR